MRFLLLLLLLFQDSLLDQLDNDDPVVREATMKKLIERESDLEKYKNVLKDTSNLEIKWRLKQIVESIEINQKFRAASTVAPLITIKFEGTATILFAKLAELTGQKFDARGFGENNVKIDCTNTPLFKILDQISKQIGYDWVVSYFDDKENRIWETPTGPITNCHAVVELTAVGMSDKTPGYTGSGFKMQATNTNFSIENILNNEVKTQVSISWRFAAEPSLNYAVGPKIKYTKAVTNEGTELLDTSGNAKIAFFKCPPTTKSISLKGTATYRFPIKVEKIKFENMELMKPDANGNASMEFVDYPNFQAIIANTNNLSILARGTDNLMKERFLGPYELKKKNGGVILESAQNNGNSGSGYISVYEDHIQFYVYGNASDEDRFSTLSFDYITEFRDVAFEFSIDNIPLY